MSTKQFCDFCGEDITSKRKFEVDIYDAENEEDIVKRDLCGQCKTKVMNAVFKIKKKINSP